MSKIKITIDGHELEAEEGQTILAVASENDILIPHLCFDESLKIYGACGLCVCEAEGMPKLLRACATKIKDGMVVHTDSPRATSARKIALELLMSDHEGDCIAPCKQGCPAHTDVQDYVKAIGEGDYTRAVALIMEHIPLPSSIGRICPHPCETECRRGLIEDPIAIAQLKGFAGDKMLDVAKGYIPGAATATGKKVSIIGGGPAGLSAAYYLTLRGHKVTIYDMMPKMGGMLRYGIPDYRLPQDVIDTEVKRIADLGVEMKTGVKVGADISFDDIRKASDAVIVAIGAWASSGIRCEGEDMDGVIGGIDMLEGIAQGQRPDLGKNVVVVGGGNTAMDACRCAVRLGAEHVSVVYRRTRNEAPADDQEISDAIDEGVEFKFLTNPALIIGKDGHVSQVKLQLMELGEPDDSGRRSPVPLEGQFETIDVDTVIAAIGQRVVPDGIDGVGLTRKGTFDVDPETFATDMPGVFAIGDCALNGPSIAVEAIADANRVALIVDYYLSTGEVVAGRYPYLSVRKVTEADFEGREKIDRVRMPQRDPKKRNRDFEAVDLGLSDDAAQAEAKRCLECGCKDYGKCMLIEYANLFDDLDPEKLEGGRHPKFKEEQLVTIERDQGKCILCGMCVRVCDEVVGKGLIGLVGRGFDTVIKPEFDNPDDVKICASCHKCADLCPTGALWIKGVDPFRYEKQDELMESAK